MPEAKKKKFKKKSKKRLKKKRRLILTHRDRMLILNYPKKRFRKK